MPQADRSEPRIGIDYWPAARHPPGIGRYVRELVRALVELPDGPPLALFDVGPGKPCLPESALGLAAAGPDRVRRRRAALPRRLFGPTAARLGLGADRWLGGVPLFQRAFPGLPCVSRALEVLPVAELPEPLSGAAARDSERNFTRALERAAHVITFSQAAARELGARYSVDPERLSVLPVGCDHWLRDATPMALDVRPARRVIIVLGALTPSRAPLQIATAVAELVARGHDLELRFLGRPGSLRDALRASPAADALGALGARLVLREPLEAELPAELAAADCLCHLSSAEWTPVTPLEGLAFGASVVASRLPAFVELLEDAVHWVPVHAPDAGPDPQQLARALELALAESRDAQAHARRRAVAQPYTWRQHARLTADLWKRILCA